MGDRQSDHGYRSIWYVMLGGKGGGQEREAYLRSLERLRTSENGLQFMHSKADEQRNDRGVEIYEAILGQHGFGKEKEAMPESLHAAEVQVTKRFARKTKSELPEALLRRVRNVLMRYGIDMSIKQLATYRKLFGLILKATDSPTYADEDPVVKRAEFEAYVWSECGRDDLKGDWVQGHIFADDDTRTKLLFVETSNDQTQQEEKKTQQQGGAPPLASSRSPPSSSPLALPLGACCGETTTTPPSRENKKTDDDDDEEERFRLKSTKKRTLVHAARLKSDEEGGSEFLVVSRQKKKKAPTKKTSAKKPETNKTPVFPQGSRVLVQERGKLFTELWPSLRDELGPLLDMSYDGTFAAEKKRAAAKAKKEKADDDDDDDDDDDLFPEVTPGSELMSFPGFCAMHARFCGGDSEDLQLVMSLMSPDAFIEKHDWLKDLLDNTVLVDANRGPCACRTTACAPASCCTAAA